LVSYKPGCLGIKRWKLVKVQRCAATVTGTIPEVRLPAKQEITRKLSRARRLCYSQ